MRVDLLLTTTISSTTSSAGMGNRAPAGGGWGSSAYRAMATMTVPVALSGRAGPVHSGE